MFLNLKDPKYWKLLLFCGLFFCLFLVFSYLYWSLKTTIQGRFRVLKIFKNGFVIQKFNNKIFIKTHTKITTDYVFIKGFLIKNINDNFLNKLSIFYSVSNPKISVIDPPIIYKFFYDIISKNDDNSQQFLNFFILSKKAFKSELYTNIQKLNIVHLFVVSGLHFYVLIFFLSKFFNFLKIKKSISNLIILIIISIYICLLNFNIAALRAYVYFVLYLIINKVLKKKVTSIDIFCIMSLINISFMPQIMISVSFILSFGLSYLGLIIFRTKTKFKTLKFTSICYFSSLILTSAFVSEFNVFGFIYQYIFSYIVIIYYFYSILFFWNTWLNIHVFEFLNWFISICIKYSFYFKFFAIDNIIYCFLWSGICSILYIQNLKTQRFQKVQFIK